jgi:hypothetical protein
MTYALYNTLFHSLCFFPFSSDSYLRASGKVFILRLNVRGKLSYHLSRVARGALQLIKPQKY